MQMIEIPLDYRFCCENIRFISIILWSNSNLNSEIFSREILLPAMHDSYTNDDQEIHTTFFIGRENKL